MNIIQKIPILVLILGLLGLMYGCSDDDDDDDNLPNNTLSLNVSLDSIQPVSQPVVDSASATGNANLTIDQDNLTLSGSVTISDASSTINNVQIHNGFAGTKGSSVLSLVQGANNNVWNVPNDAVLLNTQLDSLLAGGMYIAVHTQNNPTGELRGQISGSDTQVILVPLSGDNQVPPVTSSASGTGYLTVNTVSGDIVANVNLDNLDVTVAHIHQAFAGNSGDFVVPLTTLKNGEVTEITETSDTLESGELAALLRGEMYFNIHSEANGSGEIRGQIIPSGIAFFRVNINGEQVVPDEVITDGTGVGYVTVDTEGDDIGNIVANVRLSNIIANDVHIHRGEFGVASDDIRVPLDEGNVNDQVVWEKSQTLSSEDLTALLNGGMYFNVHTDGGLPTGDLRGQIRNDNLPEEEQLEPTFAFIQETVFSSSCASAGCHTGDSPPRGLVLDVPGIGLGSTYDLLVGQPSVGNPDVLRVDVDDPNPNPEDSYLIQMLEGVALNASGDPERRMPANGPPFLSPAVIDNIREWIRLGAPSGQEEELEPTFAFIQDTVFTTFCNSCHNETNPRGNLQLGEDETYQQLVGQFSVGVPDEQLVVPQDPENSYLIKKLELEAPDIDGARMPEGQARLPQTVIDNIRQWIEDGALEE